MRRHVLYLACVAIGGLVALSDPTWAFRKSQAEVDGLLHAQDRFVDAGIVLTTVEIHPEDRPILAVTDAEEVDALIAAGKLRGRRPATGGPPVVEVRKKALGGMWDRLAKRWIGPSQNPVQWMCSRFSEPLILHDRSMPEGLWYQGAMGASKSTTGCQWLFGRVIEHATHPVTGAGVTAPTGDRMEVVVKMLFGTKGSDGKRRGGIWRPSWFTWREGDHVATMFTGLQIDFRSGHIASAAEGSPIQGYNWAFSLNDELQDYYELDGDIQMRGRSAWRGRFQRFVTVTPKDDPGYRTFRDKKATSPKWFVQLVKGSDSPFVEPYFIETRKGEMDEREYQRKVLALDVPSERALYHTWEREQNLRPVPQVGAEDVTAQVLAPWGQNLQVLIGHDPGRRFDTSVLLKAYRIRGQAKHVWFVVDEVVTSQTTSEQHVAQLLKRLRDRWQCNELDWRNKPAEDGAQALVRADPYSNSGGGEDERPDRTIYTIFRNAGIRIMPAAFAPNPKPGSAPKAGTVPKGGRLNMMCRLLCDAAGGRRLFVACDDRKRPVAPVTVESFERTERDDAYRAEEEKGANDTSHAGAAVGYALWAIERPKHEERAA